MNKLFFNEYIFKFINFFIAICFSIILFKFTPLGLGASPDSVGYIKAATGLISGHNFSFFTNVWPPLYSILLALCGLLFDNDVIFGGRILNSIIFGLNYILFLIFIGKIIKNKPLVILLAIIATSHPLIIEIHLYAWTEPLFTSFFVINLLLLNKIIINISSNNLVKISIFISLITGFSILLRYAGVAILIGNLLTYLFLFHIKKINIRQYLLFSLSQILIPIIICLPWFLYALNRFNNATGTHFRINYFDFEKILNGLNTIGTWILNIDFIQKFSFFYPLCITVGITIIVSFYIYLLLTLFNKGFVETSLQTITTISFLSYIAFIILSSSLINVATPLDNRILSPIFSLIFFQLLFYISILSSKFFQTLFFIFLMSLVSNNIHNLKGSLYFSALNGFEYSNPSFKNRNIINLLKSCPSTIQMFSDAPWSINLFIKPNALWLPRRVNYTSGLINQKYDVEISNLNSTANIIVIINDFNEYSPLMGRLNFNKIYSGSDGEIWLNHNSYNCSN